MRAGFSAVVSYLLFGTVVAGLTMVAMAEKHPIERYQPIIDRQMFGRQPEGFDATKSPSAMTEEERLKREQQQEQLRSAIHLSAINICPNKEVAVGFTDRGNQANPKHYYMKVGETSDGWMVKSADPETAVVVISFKDEADITLTLGEDSSKKAEATVRAGEAATAAAPAGKPSADAEEESAGAFLRKRRKGREEKQRKLDEERERREEELAARRARLEERQEALINSFEDIVDQMKYRQQMKEMDQYDREAEDFSPPPEDPPPEDPPSEDPPEEEGE